MPVWSDSQGKLVTPHTNWVSIGEKLGRSPSTCSIKYKSLKFQTKGRFSREEDALILERVKQRDDIGDKWRAKGEGLWSELANELDRTAGTIRERWLAMHIGQSNRISCWTEEMVRVCSTLFPFGSFIDRVCWLCSMFVPLCTPGYYSAECAKGIQDWFAALQLPLGFCK